MGFFEDIDNISILERHSDRLEGVEMSQARKMLKEYKRARQELKLQLLANSYDNSYTEGKMKNALAQIEQAIVQLRSKIGWQIQEGFDFLSSQGIEDSVTEMDAFDKAFGGGFGKLPYDAIIESTEPDNYLFNQYESSISMYNEGLRNSFQSALTQSLIQQKSWTQAVYDMETVFDMEEWKLARIVRTELHGIYNISKMRGFGTIRNDYIPDLMKTLYHPMDSRTGQDSIQLAKENLVIPIDQPFSYTYKGKTRTFMTPPERPNDRAILIPYRGVYGKI
jgi:hypothetical protein